MAGVASFNGDSGELEPDLVTVLPSVANGGLVVNDDGTLMVIYEIDPDAMWSDGMPISGDDFAFTYEVVIETMARLEAAVADDTTDEEFFKTCGDPEPIGLLPIGVFGAGAFSAIGPDSISAGAKTFTYTLTLPTAYDPSLFRYVVPRHAVEGTDFLSDWNDRMWPSAGPFVVESLDLERHELTMVRNDNYWRTDPETGQQLPYLDTLVFTALEDEYLEQTDWIEFHRAANDCRDIFAAAGLIGLDFGSEEGQDLFTRFFAVYDEIRDALFLEGLTLDIELSPIGEPTLTGAARFSPEQVSELEAQGVEIRNVRGAFWEHIAFHYGDARFRANDDSLVEHLEFRRAIAYGLDRDRVVAEALGIPIDSVGSLVEAFSPSLSGVGWDRYDYNPDEARQLLAGLCTSLGRDCDADPPRLVFTHSPGDVNPGRARIGELIVEMLRDVGIEVDLVEQDTFNMSVFAGCSGWESSIWAWASNLGSFVPVAEMFNVFDPAASGNPNPTGRLAGFGFPGTNLYAWGTDAVTDAEDFDLDLFLECDETTVYNQDPSSVRDEFTQRFDDLLRQAETVVDPAGFIPLVLEMEDILADQAVIIPLYQRPFVRIFRADIVGGYGYQIQTGGNELWNVAEWYLVDS